MFRNTYQHNMLTVFFSCGSKPLDLWDTFIKDGCISRLMDNDIKSTVFEIRGNNVSTTYIICPKGKQTLGITMPFLVMIVKNLKKYFTFEVTALDETNTRRRFRVSNFQSTTQILPMCTAMPIGLSEGWNQIQFNLAEFMRRAYNKQFVEVQKLKINANIRLRRIYFAERLLPEDQLPPEYKLYFPLGSAGAKGKKSSKENVDTSTSLAPYEDAKEIKKGSRASVHSKMNLSQLRVSETERRKSSALQLPVTQAEKPIVDQKETVTEAVAEGGKNASADIEASSRAVDTELTEARTETSDEGALVALDKGDLEVSGEAAPEAPEEAASEVISKARSEAIIELPAEASAEFPADVLAEAPTEPPTEAPVEASGEVPTEAPVESPIEAHVEAPGEVPTEAPVEATAKAPARTSALAFAEATTEASVEDIAETSEFPAEKEAQ